MDTLYCTANVKLVDGIREAITSESGLFTPPGLSSTMAKALRDIDFGATGLENAMETKMDSYNDGKLPGLGNPIAIRYGNTLIAIIYGEE